MRSSPVRLVVVLSLLVLSAATGSPAIQQPPSGNKIEFDTGSPVSPKPGHLKATVLVFKGTGWTCDNIHFEVIGANKKEADKADKKNPANPTNSASFELKAGTYTVKATATFTKGKEKETKEVTSGPIMVQKAR